MELFAGVQDFALRTFSQVNNVLVFHCAHYTQPLTRIRVHGASVRNSPLNKMKSTQRARLEIACFVKLDLSNTKFGRQARAAVIIFEANIATGQNEGERESKQVEAVRARRSGRALP